MDAEQYRLTNERLRILVDFAARPICAADPENPDPDIISGYNLAVSSVVKAVRFVAEEMVRPREPLT